MHVYFTIHTVYSRYISSFRGSRGKHMKWKSSKEERRFNEPCFSYGFCDVGASSLVLQRMPDLCHWDRTAAWLQARPASLPASLPAPAVLRPCVSALPLSEELCCQELPATTTKRHRCEALAQGPSAWPPQSSQILLNSTGWPRVENWVQDPE